MQPFLTLALAGSFLAQAPMPNSRLAVLPSGGDDAPLRLEVRQAAKGKLALERRLTLSDPRRLIPWTIAHELLGERDLTRLDFDARTLACLPDGSFWLADAAGPSLLHVDAAGRVLEAPVRLPDPDQPGRWLASPRSPVYEEGTPLRILTALRTFARANGGRKPVVCSPSHRLIADGDPATGEDHRLAPPAGSGLAPASSEIFDPKALARAGFPLVPWTINDPARMSALVAAGVTGLITDRPDRARALKLPAPFDLQGHRGARDLRPENTLPSFEAGLDELVDTLEADCQLTRDGVLVLSHEGKLLAPALRRTDGRPMVARPIREVGFDELQAAYLADGLLPGRPDQRNARSRSPVAVAFAREHGLADPYVMPSLDQLFDFVEFYAAFYAGSDPRRADNARRVAFNLETKGRPYAFDGEPVADVARMARAIAGHARTHGVAGRTAVESFAFEALLAVARDYPELQLVALFGDSPAFGDLGDGTNLQGPASGASPWLAGLRWPYRRTFRDEPPRVVAGGGPTAIALDPGGKLHVMLGAPLPGQSARRLFEYDPARHRWTPQ